MELNIYIGFNIQQKEEFTDYQYITLLKLRLCQQFCLNLLFMGACNQLQGKMFRLELNMWDHT